MTTRVKKFCWGAGGACVALFPVILMAHYDGPDTRHTGAPGDDQLACATAQCHTSAAKGGPINSGGGNVSATFSSGSTYTPGGEAITITVSAADPVNKHFGFQMSARLASNLSNGQAGSFNPGTNPNVVVLCGQTDNFRPKGGCASGDVEFIEHDFTNFSAVNPTSTPYIFTWTPPATNVGNVTFYVAGNVVNYNGVQDGGDHVYTASYKLTPASAPPTIVTGGVLNAASFAKDSTGLGMPVSPGSLVAIFGSNFGPTQADAASAPFNDTLANVSVTVNNIPAPIRDVLPNGAYPTINAQVPFGVVASAQTGTVPVVVTVNGVASSPQNVQIVAQAPGIFTIPSGLGNAVLVNLNDCNASGCSIAAPAGSIAGLTCRPIARGQAAFFYATGLGAMTPAVIDGSDGGTTTHNVNAMPTVLVDGIPVTPGFAGQAPLYPGVYQVNITIPQGVHSGVVNLQIQSADGTVTSAAGISTVAVQ